MMQVKVRCTEPEDETIWMIHNFNLLLIEQNRAKHVANKQIRNTSRELFLPRAMMHGIQHTATSLDCPLVSEKNQYATAGPLVHFF